MWRSRGGRGQDEKRVYSLRTRSPLKFIIIFYNPACNLWRLFISPRFPTYVVRIYTYTSSIMWRAYTKATGPSSLRYPPALHPPLCARPFARGPCKHYHSRCARAYITILLAFLLHMVLLLRLSPSVGRHRLVSSIHSARLVIIYLFPSESCPPPSGLFYKF